MSQESGSRGAGLRGVFQDLWARLVRLVRDSWTRLRAGREARSEASSPERDALLGLLAGHGGDAELLRALRDLHAPPASAEEAALSELVDWLAWLLEKTPLLEETPQNQAGEQLMRWHRVLDFHAWAEPEEELALAPLREWLPPDAVHSLVSRLRDNQRRLQEALSQKGLQRIQAPPGSAFVAGAVEWSEQPPQETQDPALHHRVFRLEPGEGGYRAASRVLVPSRARRYVYRGGGEVGA